MELTRTVLELKQVKQMACLPEEHFLVAWQNPAGLPMTYEVSSQERLFVLSPPLPDLLVWLYDHRTCCPRVVLVHNHPAKYLFSCLPSDQDLIASEYLRWQMAALGIELVDSVIVTATKHWSFREHGLLQSEEMVCSGEDMLDFILVCLMQVATILPDHLHLIETFCNEVEQSLAEVNHWQQRPWYKRLLEKEAPLYPQFSQQPDRLLEAIAASLRQHNLTFQHPVSYRRLLQFGQFLQGELFRTYLFS